MSITMGDPGLAPAPDSSPSELVGSSAVPLPRAGGRPSHSLAVDPSIRLSPSLHSHAEGEVYRGLFYGLLLAVPFWLLVAVLVLSLV